ncbi:acetyltransferase [Siccibacter colletis]|uniref:Acetyltransferase n=1 Tax=Siccibacter colletis TaxID=1505757 RepID=A0ABY6JA62_9ENTR|nr:acetyltransferase [Siccibacter colletis]UYU30727.1 acetyltransferase [Siccibacter colletis]
MSKVNDKPIAIIGGGGHASVLADILINQKRKIVALILPSGQPERQVFNNIPVYNDDQFAEIFSPEEISIVNGIGFIPHSQLRETIYHKYKAAGFIFETIISTDAIISPYAKVQEGVQILHGAVVQSGALIKRNSIVNTRAVVEHDSIIGCHNHVAPGSLVCGGAVTDDAVFLGAGSVVIQGINISKRCIVGAGCIIKHDLSENSLCFSPSPRIESIRNTGVSDHE